MRKPRPGPGRMAFSAAIAAAVAVPLLTTATAAGAAPYIPAFCGGTGAISASGLASPVNVRACHITGRMVVMDLGRGRPEGAVHVQEPGKGQTVYVTTTSGEYALTVNTDTHGNVVAKQSFAGASAATRRAARMPAIPAADPACNESSWAGEGGIWYSPNSTPTLLWYYNESTASRAGLSGSATLSDIRAGNANITNGINNCGFAEYVFAIHGAYEGTTSLYANINSGGQCTSNFPDGQNTVSWGPFNNTSTLAVTCVENGSFNGEETITEADIYVGSNVHIVDSLPPNCTNQEDLQTVVTHEWGHAFGLAHAPNGPDEVMAPGKPPCALRRHLGDGDWIGMASLYGYS